MHHPTIAAVLVAVAVALAVVCAMGMTIMKKTLERLHFSASVTSFSAALITLAVWLDDPDWQARLKSAVILLILFVMNSILSHSTARAVRIREDRHFEPEPEEHLPLIAENNPTGTGS